MVRGGRFAYFHPDGLGSVTAATDSRGVLTESYRYRAFGEPTVTDATGRILSSSRLGNPYLFTGREYDPETGLYHYRRRSYDPSVGRFLTRDPLSGSPTRPSTWHRYSYVENNPINRLDPFGLRAERAEPPSRLEALRSENRTSGVENGAPSPSGGMRREGYEERVLGPGGFFDNPEQAAIDATGYINDRSITENIEYGGWIFEENDRFTYDEPRPGTVDSVEIPWPRPEDRAWFHTHGATLPGYDNENFSDPDRSISDTTGKPAYLGTPEGRIRRYDPVEREEALIRGPRRRR